MSGQEMNNMMTKIIEAIIKSNNDISDEIDKTIQQSSNYIINNMN